MLGWWNAAKENSNILYLFYEDFVIDRCGYVDKVAAFLDVKLTESEKIAIIEKVNIENMRGSEKTDYLEGRVGTVGFMRKGIIGDWITHFSEQQNEIYESWYIENVVQKSNNELTFTFTHE